MDEQMEKTTVKEKLMEKKSKAKEWIISHKKGLIRGGVIAGAIAAVGGTIAAVVNRCGLPCGDSFSYEEIDYYEEDCDPSEELEVEVSEESEES